MSEKYDNFLNSEWWQYLRELKLKEQGCCEACGSKKNLHIHHSNYKYKYSGNVVNALRYLRVLCGSCHFAIHKNCGVKFNMKHETNRHISMTRRRTYSGKYTARPKKEKAVKLGIFGY